MKKDGTKKKMMVEREADDAETTRRLTQAQRSHETRERVLNAAIGLLHAEGYSGATTLAIRKAADVSMGAMQHQFPTKAELMAAVQERLIEVRFQRFTEVSRGMGSPHDRIERLLDLAGELIGSPLFAASLEIQLARRSDQELEGAIAPIRQRFGSSYMGLTDNIIEGMGNAASKKIKQLQMLTGAMVRGLTVDVVSGGSLEEARAAFQLWRELISQLVTEDAAPLAPARDASTKTPKRHVKG